jgi:Zn-dependent M16 (insulinase) family peptidase
MPAFGRNDGMAAGDFVTNSCAGMTRMGGESMTTDDINSAIDAAQNYIETLKVALAAVANKGNSVLATRLGSRLLDANALEENLTGMLTIATIEDLKTAIGEVSQVTQVLDRQKGQIDAMIKAVGSAATVMNDIASISAAVAKLAAGL